jgi:hypothetical protein
VTAIRDNLGAALANFYKNAILTPLPPQKNMDGRGNFVSTQHIKKLKKCSENATDKSDGSHTQITPWSHTIGTLHIIQVFNDFVAFCRIQLFSILEYIACTGIRLSQTFLKEGRCDKTYDCMDRSDESNCDDPHVGDTLIVLMCVSYLMVFPDTL